MNKKIYLKATLERFINLPTPYAASELYHLLITAVSSFSQGSGLFYADLNEILIDLGLGGVTSEEIDEIKKVLESRCEAIARQDIKKLELTRLRNEAVVIQNKIQSLEEDLNAQLCKDS